MMDRRRAGIRARTLKRQRRHLPVPIPTAAPPHHFAPAKSSRTVACPHADPARPHEHPVWWIDAGGRRRSWTEIARDCAAEARTRRLLLIRHAAEGRKAA